MSLTGDPGEGQSSVSGRHTGERVLRNAGDRRAMGKRSGGGLEVRSLTFSLSLCDGQDPEISRNSPS